ncbi:MAG: cytochrome b/b6 domain-containing protein [Pseudomonadota bacterium]
MLSNTRATYGLIAQLLHWATAILILILLPLGLYMHNLPIGSEAELQNKFWFYSLHKTLGITVFAIAIIRVLWAFIQPRPALLNTDKKLENFAAHTVHWLLYGSIIIMPLTGWLHHSATEGFAEIWWPFMQDLPFVPKDETVANFLGFLHFACAVVLVISLLLHIGGAMKHTVIDRDSTLARMIPGMKPNLPELKSEPTSNTLPITVTVIAFLVAAGVTAVKFDGHDHSTHDHAAEESQSTQQAQTEAEETASSASNAVSKADAWAVDYANSTLGIQAIQNNSPVVGSFTAWTAEINFSPDDLENSRVSVEVDIASLALGSVTKQALDVNFLNVGAHPKATFLAEEFAELGPGQFEAKGQLTLAGVTSPLSLSFTLVIAENRATVEGRALIKRLDFGIGAKGFTDGKTVGLDVEVIVNLQADRNS